MTSIDQAAEFAARITAVIDYRHSDAPCGPKCARDLADRERVASDLAGLRQHVLVAGLCQWCQGQPWHCPDSVRYADNLRRTGALYGVTP